MATTYYSALSLHFKFSSPGSIKRRFVAKDITAGYSGGNVYEQYNYKPFGVTGGLIDQIFSGITVQNNSNNDIVFAIEPYEGDLSSNGSRDAEYVIKTGNSLSLDTKIMRIQILAVGSGGVQVYLRN